MNTLETNVTNSIGTITLNRPEALNALNAVMMSELREATSAFEHDPAVRAVVVNAKGPHFMAGGDLKFFAETLSKVADSRERRNLFEGFVGQLHPVMTSLRRMPKPVIAAVKGAVAGFGMSLMMASDLAVAADDAYFTLAYVNIGTSPDGSSTYVLPRLVGLKRAMEIALLADRFDATRAYTIGLVNRVVPVAELEANVAALAERLAKGPTLAYAKTKTLLNQSLESEFNAQLQAEAEAFAACAASGDFERGIEAFTSKKQPEFFGS
ncbi:MAG: enoyl-CoA hydratase/isomerase family protein [Clostridia bacterium]|nr:enoyl-CoA hydratase/isomerase family protein [Deltaproteobacteria bacterium]